MISAPPDDGLPAGKYVVEFTGLVCRSGEGCRHPFIRQFYEGKSTLEEATRISFDGGTISGIDASLDAELTEGGSISGSVTVAVTGIEEVAPRTPGVTSLPVLSGTPVVGASLSCSPGAWTNNPTSLGYAWLRDGVVISGQTGTSYTVQSADEGHVLTCQVTASNAAGSTSASSNAAAVPTKPPAKPPVEKPAAKGVAVAEGAAKVLGETVRLALSCPGAGACGGVVKLIDEVAKGATRHAEHRRGGVVIGEASFAIPADGHLTLWVHVNAAGWRLLARSGRRGLTVRLIGSGMRARTLAIRRAHRPHKKRRG